MPTRKKRSVILHPAVIRDLIESEPRSVKPAGAAAAAADDGGAAEAAVGAGTTQLTAKQQDLIRRRDVSINPVAEVEDIFATDLLQYIVDSKILRSSLNAKERALLERARAIKREQEQAEAILKRFKKDEKRRVRDQRIKDSERLLKLAAAPDSAATGGGDAAASAEAASGAVPEDIAFLCQYVADYDESDREELVSDARVEFGKSPLDWAVATALDVDHTDTVGGIKWAWQEHQRQWEKFYDTETEREIFAAIIKDMPWYKRPFYRQFMPTSQVAEYHKIQVRYGRAKENQPKVIKKIAKLLTEENFPILYERCQEQVRALNVRNLAALAKSSPVILEILLSDVVVQRKLAKAGLWTEVYQDFWNNFKGQSISEECPLARAVLSLQQRIDEIKFSDRVREMKGRATICLRNQGSNFVYGLDRDGSESDLFVIRVNPNYARKFIMGQLDDMDEFISGLNNFRAMYKKCRPQIQRLSATDLATLAKTHWEVLDLLLRDQVIVKKLRKANLLTGIYETVSAKAKVLGTTPENIEENYPFAAAVLTVQNAINEVKLWDCVKNVSSRKSIYLRNLAQKLGDASYEELLVIQYNKDYYETLIGYVEKYNIGRDGGAVIVYSAAEEFEKILDQKRQDRIEEALPAARVEEGESVATYGAVTSHVASGMGAAAAAAVGATGTELSLGGEVTTEATDEAAADGTGSGATEGGDDGAGVGGGAEGDGEPATPDLDVGGNLDGIDVVGDSSPIVDEDAEVVQPQEDRYEAAIVIQRRVRGKQARRRVEELKERRTAVATTLQSYWRGRTARKEVARRQEVRTKWSDSIEKIQKMLRGAAAFQSTLQDVKERRVAAAAPIELGAGAGSVLVTDFVVSPYRERADGEVGGDDGLNFMLSQWQGACVVLRSKIGELDVEHPGFKSTMQYHIGINLISIIESLIFLAYKRSALSTPECIEKFRELDASFKEICRRFVFKIEDLDHGSLFTESDLRTLGPWGLVVGRMVKLPGVFVGKLGNGAVIQAMREPLQQIFGLILSLDIAVHADDPETITYSKVLAATGESECTPARVTVEREIDLSALTPRQVFEVDLDTGERIIIDDSGGDDAIADQRRDDHGAITVEHEVDLMDDRDMEIDILTGEKRAIDGVDGERVVDLDDGGCAQTEREIDLFA